MGNRRLADRTPPLGDGEWVYADLILYRRLADRTGSLDDEEWVYAEPIVWNSTCYLERLLGDDGAPELQEFQFNYRQLNMLPENFGVLRGLLRLFLGHNQLTSLPQSFGQLVALEELWIGLNQLTSLPETFGQLIALQAVF